MHIFLMHPSCGLRLRVGIFMILLWTMMTILVWTDGSAEVDILADVTVAGVGAYLRAFGWFCGFNLQEEGGELRIMEMVHRSTSDDFKRHTWPSLGRLSLHWKRSGQGISGWITSKLSGQTERAHSKYLPHAKCEYPLWAFLG